jgi:hypothetical protein
MNNPSFRFARFPLPIAFTLALAIGGLSLTACGISDNAMEAADAMVADGSSLTAQVDGKAWSSDLGAFFIGWGKGVSITGMSGLAQSLTLTMDSSAVGDYRVTASTSFAIALDREDGMYLAKSGIIHVTRAGQDFIEGTFEGQLQRDDGGARKLLVISNGKFKAKPAEKGLHFVSPN